MPRNEALHARARDPERARPSALHADEARIKTLQQKIDDFDGKIRQVVRDIAVTTDPPAIQELNRLKKQYETQRSTAVFDSTSVGLCG